MKDFFNTSSNDLLEGSRRLIQTPSAFARKAFFYVQETGCLKLQTSRQHSRKNLESYLIVLVLSGKGTLMYQDHLYELTQGSLFFIDCMNPYYHQSSTTAPWELLWVHFNGSSSKEYCQYFSAVGGPVCKPAGFLEIQKNLELLMEVNTSSELSAEITSSRLIVEILSSILLERTAGNTKQHPAYGKMMEIRSYLDEHFTEKFSLDALSSQFFISKYHLSREFKNHCGMSPNNYVISKRLTLAKKLLRFTSLSLDEISRQCGFYDTSYLNRQFQKSEGITASQFRKKWIN